MENQIKASLITLHKIAKFTADTRIDTSGGDCDEYLSTPAGDAMRAATGVMQSHRDRAIALLLQKYNQVKEHTQYILESNSVELRSYLPQIRERLEKSKEGLTLYKSNPRYMADRKITSTVDHLLQEEIPRQIARIDEFGAVQ